MVSSYQKSRIIYLHSLNKLRKIYGEIKKKWTINNLIIQLCSKAIFYLGFVLMIGERYKMKVLALNFQKTR